MPRTACATPSSSERWAMAKPVKLASMPPSVETKPEKKSTNTMNCRAQSGQRTSSSLQMKGRIVRYDQIMSFVLSHSHGANFTKQQRMKMASAGRTQRRAKESLDDEDFRPHSVM